MGARRGCRESSLEAYSCPRRGNEKTYCSPVTTAAFAPAGAPTFNGSASVCVGAPAGANRAVHKPPWVTKPTAVFAPAGAPTFNAGAPAAAFAPAGAPTFNGGASVCVGAPAGANRAVHKPPWVTKPTAAFAPAGAPTFNGRAPLPLRLAARLPPCRPGQRSPSASDKVLVTGLVRYCSTVFDPVLISTVEVMPGRMSRSAWGRPLNLRPSVRTRMR